MKAKEFLNESMQDSINNAFQNSLQYVSGPMLPKVNGNYRLQDVMKRVKEIKDAIERAKAKGKLNVNSPEYKSAMSELQKWDQWLKDSQNIDKWHPERLKEAVDESWVQAYQAMVDNGGEPTPDKPTLFIKQLAMLAKESGILSTDLLKTTRADWFIRSYINDDRMGEKLHSIKQRVGSLVDSAPTVEQIKQYRQQSQIQATQFQQGQEVAAARHNASIQQIINQAQLDQADTQAVLAMDVEARQAILAKKQQMELEAKERLAQIEIDIRNSQEPEAERAQALELARMNNAHELQVIQLTAEGEYKKAKLEAEYQIQIKQLENIDNAEERQNKLDVINANKAKEIAIINAETKAKIEGLQAETTAERESSDIRIQEAFMMTFKPIWGNLIQQASQLGKTLSQSISAVTGALGRLSKPVMPQAQKPANEDIERLKQLAGR